MKELTELIRDFEKRNDTRIEVTVDAQRVKVYHEATNSFIFFTTPEQAYEWLETHPKPKKPDIPRIANVIRSTEVRDACIGYINYLASDEYHEDSEYEYRNAIFEAAMEAVYGNDIWDYVNKIQS
jgi:hypothetical protein